MKKFLREALKTVESDLDEGVCQEFAKEIKEMLSELREYDDEDESAMESQDEELEYIMIHGKRRITVDPFAKTRKSRVSTVLKPNDFEEKIDANTFLGFSQRASKSFATFLKYIQSCNTLHYRDAMQNYMSKPMHPLIYFSKANKLSKSFSMQTHANVRSALMNPSTYLPIHNDDPLSDVFSDTCILFSLHLECGKMINMKDMLTSFTLSVKGTDAEILLAYPNILSY